MDIHDSISRARGILLVAAPYLARAFFRMRWEADATVPTAAVTPAWRVRVNPGWWASLPSDGHRAFIFMHECQHVLGEYFRRSSGMTAMTTAGVTVANLAHDVIVNETIASAWPDIPIPDGAITRAGLGVPEDRTTFEAVYDWLIANIPPEVDPSVGDVSGEDEAPEGDEEILIQQIAADIREYAKAGSVPGELLMWADAVLAPCRVRWDAILRPLVQRVVQTWERGQDAPSFSRRNRRQHIYGRVVLPGRVRARPEITIIADTSGSMGGSGTKVVSSVRGLLDWVRGDVRVIFADAAVQGDTRVRSVREMKAQGGGGTDLRGAFDLARGSACIICITDGYMPPVEDRAVWLIVDGEAQDWMNGPVVVWEEQ